MAHPRHTVRALLVTLLFASVPAWADGLPLVEPAKSAHQLGDTPFSVQGAVTLAGGILASVAVIFTIVWGFRKMRRENDADAAARANEIKEAHRADADRIEKAQRERSDEIKVELRDLRVSLGERLKAVETAIVDFMPRGEIESKMEHEKNNRVAGDNAAANALQRHDDRLGRLEVDVGRMAERQGGIITEVGEMKGLLKDVSREMAAGFDKMRDQISHVGARA